MKQAKFSISDEQLVFLDKHKAYGFKDRSECVREALERLRLALHREEIERSAALYAELLEEDIESTDWLEDAVREWPE